MSAAEIEFTVLVRPVLERFFRQTGRPAMAAAVLAKFEARLWALVSERGVPPPLPLGERGEPREMTAEEAAPLLERLLAGFGEMERLALETPARQLVKACFHGEFKNCRNSFREREVDGSCRRQQLAKATGRVSGAHCVDCPYWLELAPEQHAKFLAREWRPDGAEELVTCRSVFLPEDFRALRRHIRQLSRQGMGGTRSMQT